MTGFTGTEGRIRKVVCVCVCVISVKSQLTVDRARCVCVLSWSEVDLVQLRKCSCFLLVEQSKHVVCVCVCESAVRTREYVKNVTCLNKRLFQLILNLHKNKTTGRATEPGSEQKENRAQI